MEYKGRTVYFDREKSCYDCRFLKFVGQMMSGKEHFTCSKFRDYRDPYGFNSTGCTEFFKSRMPRKKKKEYKKRIASAKDIQVSFTEYGNTPF